MNLDCKLSDRALANITELARMRLLYASCLVLVCFDLSTSCWIVSYSEVVLIMKITGGGPTLFLSVDFVNILPKKGGGQTLMFTKALTKF